MKPPAVTLYPRYAAHSRTLRGPFYVTGIVAERVTEIDSHKRRINEGKPACFGDSIPPGTMQFFDIGLAPQSGDYVMVWTDTDQICKRYFVVNGEPFLVCHWYSVPLSWLPNVRAIGVLVAEASIDGWHDIAHQVMVTDEADAQWRRELNSRQAVHNAIGRILEVLNG